MEEPIGLYIFKFIRILLAQIIYLWRLIWRNLEIWWIWKIIIMSGISRLFSNYTSRLTVYAVTFKAHFASECNRFNLWELTWNDKSKLFDTEIVQQQHYFTLKYCQTYWGQYTCTIHSVLVIHTVWFVYVTITELEPRR